MNRINTMRVIIAGLVAGLVMNVIEGVTNGVLLADRWAAETNALNPGLMAKTAQSGMIGWIVVDFLTGIFLVWTYAAIRPRFGPGVNTAMRAGLVVFLVRAVSMWSYVFQGMFSSSLMLMVCFAGLVAQLAGAYVGGMLYKEEEPVRAASMATA